MTIEYLLGHGRSLEHLCQRVLPTIGWIVHAFLLMDPHVPWNLGISVKIKSATFINICLSELERRGRQTDG